MTNGTSQGLFIVVAIVIFGVFAALSYTVFGDTLTPQLHNLVDSATEQSMRKVMLNPNLITIDGLTSFESYHSAPLVDGNNFSVEISRDSHYLAVRHSGFVPSEQGVYTVSGYMFKNGEPVTYDEWRHKTATTYQRTENFFVDDETGYFESTSVWRSTTHRDYMLHTRIRDAFTGDILTINDLKVEEGNFATRR